MVKLNSGSLTTVQFGEFAYDHNLINRVVREKRRPKEAIDLLRHLLALEGWNAAYGLGLLFDSKSPIWNQFKNDDGKSRYQEVLDKTYEDRKAQLEHLQKPDNNDPDKEVKLKVFKALFMQGDVVIKPKYLITAGTGRSEVYFDAMVARLKGYYYPNKTENKIAHEPKPDVVSDIPVQFHVFATEAERIDAQLKENDKKNGQFEPTSLDKLRSINVLYKISGLTYQQARNKVPGTTGQKAWLLSELDALWSTNNRNCKFKDEPQRENINIVERCFYKPSDAGYVSFAGFDSSSIGRLTELIDRSTPEGLTNRNKKIADKNDRLREEGRGAEVSVMLQRATSKDIEDYVSNKHEKPPTQLPKKTWESFNKGSSGTVPAMFAKAQLSGTSEPILVVTENASIFDKLISLIESGKNKDFIMSALSSVVLDHPLFPLFVEYAMTEKTFSVITKEASDKAIFDAVSAAQNTKTEEVKSN